MGSIFNGILLSLYFLGAIRTWFVMMAVDKAIERRETIAVTIFAVLWPLLAFVYGVIVFMSGDTGIFGQAERSKQAE